MHHTCLTGNRLSCISYNRHGFHAEGDLGSPIAAGERCDRNTSGYLPAAKEGNVLIPANFPSIWCGFPDCPSLAEGGGIANQSSGCRGPTGDVTVLTSGTGCPLNKLLEK